MKKTFRELLSRLEEITDILEKGDCDLETAMELYKEGMDISKECNKKLLEAKQTVEKFGEADT